MKLLFDENLSPGLAAAFQSDYPGSTQVHLIEAALRDKRAAIDRLESDADPAVLIV